MRSRLYTTILNWKNLRYNLSALRDTLTPGPSELPRILQGAIITGVFISLWTAFTLFRSDSMGAVDVHTRCSGYAALLESGKAAQLRCVSTFPSQCGQLDHGGSAEIYFEGECVRDRSSQMPSPWRFLLGLPMDLNLVDVAALKLLAGIGKKRAQAIVTHRRENGDFNRIEELQEISGIGPKTVERLRAHLYVGR